MIAGNIFKAIGDFCTNVLFAPFKGFRFADSWWSANIVNWLFIIVFFVLLAYWMKESLKFKKEGTEDLPK